MNESCNEQPAGALKLVQGMMAFGSPNPAGTLTTGTPWQRPSDWAAPSSLRWSTPVVQLPESRQSQQLVG